jgi:hypothetical protein
MKRYRNAIAVLVLVLLLLVVAGLVAAALSDTHIPVGGESVFSALRR